MNRRLAWLVALQAVLIAVLAGLLLWPHAVVAPGRAGALPAAAPAGADGVTGKVGETPARGDEARAKDSDRAGKADDSGSDAIGSVHLGRDVQQASGIRLAALRAAHAPPAGEAWGEVVAAQGLAEARLRLRQAAADAGQYDAALARARQERARLDGLWEDGANVARKLVEQAHSDQAQLEQRQEAARSLQEAVRATVRSEWGTLVLEQLEQPEAGALAALLAGRERLLLLPAGTAPRGEVTVPGQPGLRVAVKRLAPATQAVSGARQPSWYWLGDGEALRVGERVHMRLEASGVPAGVEVPEAAVVWQSGQSWVYQAEGPEQFHRVAVPLGPALDGGWFAAGPLAAGQQVVVQGAQLLLSEESRALIRNENGD